MKLPLRVLSVLAAGSLWLAGCSTTPREPSRAEWDAARQRAASEPVSPEVQKYFALLYAEGPRNRTLNWMLVGSESLRQGDWKTAARAFDEAIRFIESLQKGNEEAEQAKDTFTAEEMKPFKGEPYERVMAYLYRGLLYYQAGDYGNALACAKSGALQDQATLDQVYAADFNSLDMLAVLAGQRAGRLNEAQQAWARLAARDASLPKAMPDLRTAVLVVANLGDAPVKIAGGMHGEKLFIRPGDRDSGTVKVSDGWYAAGDDLAWQAMTRGGRQMDHILADKAVFKGATDAAGSVLLIGGGVAAAEGLSKGNDTVAMAGGAAVVAGIISKALSGAAVPDADTRTWFKLPSDVTLVAGNLPAQDRSITLTMTGNGTRETRTVNIPPNSNTATPDVVWVW